MATILLSAAGAAVGGLSSGTFLGLTGAVLGRAVGATIGRVIDQRLLGAGSDVVEQGRIDRFRVTGASEGATVARLHGQMRLGGQVIWATRFQENVTVTGGGKGAPAQPKTANYSYSINLALALCEGEITRVGRVWADGAEIAKEDLVMRVYRGTDDQMPDPKMEAVEGAGEVPAYRGIAYVVIEDLDLTQFGNRVPQLSFEVIRHAQPALLDTVPQPSEAVRGVAMMPGTGEYALATTPVTYSYGFGKTGTANINTANGEADFLVSLGNLQGEMPNCGAVSLIVSWFGDDLRAGHCLVKPKVEQSQFDGTGMPWRVAGLDRSTAEVIAEVDGRAIYGGTPTDQSVIEAIQAMNDAGQDVMFYPFLLMEILEGSGLPDPWSDTGEQAALPWRGRITGEKAPGISGTPDKTAAAANEVAAFFGTAAASDFSVLGSTVTYTGPSEWSYRRFVLHNAALCAAAGGVESFCIGSEMRSLTQLRDVLGFPAVRAFVDLAAEVRALLPDAKLSYAADWSEYFGYHPQDGTGDVYFHLDPLWADANIDFIGIDNYMPLSDWRDGRDHADIGYGAIYNLDYLMANIEGGEGFDWFYASSTAREAQKRTEITDGTYAEDWTFRYKDISGWWLNRHIDRRGGTKLTQLTVNGVRQYDWNFADQTYWLVNANYDEDELAGADTIDQFASVDYVFDPIEGDVLQVSDEYKITTERGWRPIIKDQAIEVSIRTRLLSEPSDGHPHRYKLWLVYLDADGNHAGFKTVAIWQGLTVADGWVEDVLQIYPDSFPGTSGIPSDAKGWRLRLGINGSTPTSPVGAVQQISEIRFEVLNGESAWEPGLKPLRFTELGCAAIEKGTNQPNKFLDPKSSESSLPYFSNGRRDDLIQMQYLRAMLGYWADPENNPVSDVYGGPMLDMDHAYVWAWDARPWPAFPNNQELWSDGENHARGHWMSGRMGAQPLADVVAEICEEAGVFSYDVSELYGFVRGFASSDVESARARLQPLMLAYGFEAIEREGMLVFRSRTGLADGVIDADRFAEDDEGAVSPVSTRSPKADMVGRVRLSHVEAAGAYEARVAEAIFPDDGEDGISQSDLPLVLTQAEGRAIAERWLAEARVARDSVGFSLPPSRHDLGAGSVVEMEDGSTWRIDQFEDKGAIKVEAVRTEMALYEPSDTIEEAVTLEPFVAPVPVSPVFMDLPLLTGDEVPHAPHMAIAAEPWPGQVAVYSAPTDSGYSLNRLFDVVSAVGVLETPLFAANPGSWDRGAAVRVRMSTGTLSSAAMEDVLNGANVAAIGDGDGANWEVIQFADAVLIEEDVWDISLRLRGQAGSDGIMPEDWPVGSLFVLLDGRPGQIEMALSARGLERHYRIGQAAKSYDHDSYTHVQIAFDGVGLRPYSPAHLRARHDGTGREISWIRRTRIDGDSWQGTEVPLGEDTESYLVQIRDGSGLQREVTVGTPSYTYSDTQAAADGVTLPYTIDVAQISAQFGPGPFARIEIND